MAQPETGGVRKTDGESAKLETLSDDEEITIPSQDRDRNIDICDEQSENTQREDLLLPTEPMHGARPRQSGGERPPAMENPVFRDAAEISAIRHPSGTLRLSRTADFYGRGSIHTSEGGGGGVRPLSLRVWNEKRELCLRFFRRTLYEMVVKVRRMSGRR